MSEIKVEIGQYREVNKGALKAFFSLLIQPQGQKIMDCRYFVSGENRWFSFPSKEILKKGQEKPEYMPLISYLNKEYKDQLNQAVMDALKTQGNHANSNNSKIQFHSAGQIIAKENAVQNQPQSSWQELPF